jgi:hypothetical protein
MNKIKRKIRETIQSVFPKAIPTRAKVTCGKERYIGKIEAVQRAARQRAQEKGR